MIYHSSKVCLPWWLRRCFSKVLPPPQPKTRGRTFYVGFCVLLSCSSAPCGWVLVWLLLHTLKIWSLVHGSYSVSKAICDCLAQHFNHASHRLNFSLISLHCWYSCWAFLSGLSLCSCCGQALLANSSCNVWQRICLALIYASFRPFICFSCRINYSMLLNKHNFF